MNDKLLKLIFQKHGLKYTGQNVSKIKKKDSKVSYIEFNKKKLFFETEWLNLKIINNALMPTDEVVSKIDVGTILKTKFDDRYIVLDKKPKYPSPQNLGELSEKEHEIFVKTVKRFERREMLAFYDEFAYNDFFTRQEAAFVERAYINADDTTNLVIMSQLENPKKGCDAHQGRVHWRNVPDERYMSLQDAYNDGLHFPNCRHSISLFYEGINTIPKLDYTIDYEDSERKQQVDNSAKIRRLLIKKDATIDKQKIKIIDAKIAALKKQGYNPYRI